jgi:DNA-binding IclR family transcriptional regulator
MKETTDGPFDEVAFHAWDGRRVTAAATRVAPRPDAGSAGIAAVLDVLDALDRRGPASCGELARQTGIAKSTIHRACSVMSARGWVTRDPATGCVALGPRIAWLARATPASVLIASFQAVAQRLVAEHNETTCLAMLDGRESVFIAKQDTTHPVRLMTAVGSRLPAFAAASGRAMLADQPDAAVVAMYASEDLVTPTGVRLTFEDLLAVLRRVRARGYAENIDETALGLHCVAAPVGPPGRVAAALTICVPSGRMTRSRHDVLVEAVIAGARSLAWCDHEQDSDMQSKPRRMSTP